MKSNPKRDAVLAAYRNNPGATLAEYGQKVGISAISLVRHYLVQLTDAGVICWTPRPRGNCSVGRDHRKYNDAETREKKAAAGRKGRGADIKKDPELEERINLVVRRAKRQERVKGGSDVVRGEHGIRLVGLRASRVG